MKDKLEVGMYVRTNKGIIDKIDNKNIMIYEVSLMGFGEKPIKASHNIIDLIEVGDYVNGNEVIEKDLSFVYTHNRYGNRLLCKDENIKSIVTKEQFSSMEYKVGDKNE